MKNEFEWFNWGREKQKLRSEVVENARKAVEERTRREFNWAEFSPKDNNGNLLLERRDVFESLGIDSEPKADNVPRPRAVPLEDGAIKWIWQTNVPGLNFVRSRASGSSVYDDHFEIEEPANEEIKHQDQPKKESFGRWNKRMWNQPDADEQAKKELDEVGERIKKESQ